MDKIGDLVMKRLDDHRLGEEALAASVVRGANSVSEGIFDAIRYKNGVLTVTVPSSSHASEAQLRLAGLKPRIRERISPHPLTRVIIRVV